jgi:hypothetical protein
MDDVNIGVKCVALINSGCIAKSNHFWFEKKNSKQILQIGNCLLLRIFVS